MFSEFKAFIARGNVLDLAVGVIIGGAFGGIVTAMTDDLLMPIVGAIFGGLDFTNHFLALGAVPAGTEMTLAGLKAANVPVLGYGSFITAVINFLILAFVIFLIVRTANRMMAKMAKEQEAAAPPPPAGPSEIDLLTEIRDALRK
jgi:large conductance mechanosensitive channel